MTTGSPQTDRLHIERFRAEYVVSREHPDSHGVGRRLDAVVERLLPGVMAAALERHFAGGGDDVWLIRSLRLNLDLDAGRDPESLARLWATQLVRLLTAFLQEGTDGDEVLHFPNRAAYLARFLMDAADGTAWDKWYYRRFEGLRLLSTSAAMRTALLNVPELGLEALLSLSPGQRLDVLHGLTAQDARRVLEELSGHIGASSSAQLPSVAAVARVLEQDVQQPLPDSVEHIALSLFLGVCKQDIGSSGRDLLRLVRAVAVILVRQQTLGSRQGDALLQALATKNVGHLYQLLGGQDGDVAAPLAGEPEKALSMLVAAFRRRLLIEAPQIWGAPNFTAQGPRYTPFGGLFMLLPLLERLPLDAACADWPSVEGLAGAGLARFLVLVKCVGQARARHCFADPLLRDVLGIPPRLGEPEALAWCERIGATQVSHLTAALVAQDASAFGEVLGERGEEDSAYLTLPGFLCASSHVDAALSDAAWRLLRLFARHLPGFGQSSVAYLYHNFLEVTAGVEAQADRYVVRLGRPPINVVLAMTGLARATFHLPWLGDKPFALFQED